MESEQHLLNLPTLELIKMIQELKDENAKLKAFIDENSVETIERKMEPYYDALAKIWEED